MFINTGLIVVLIVHIQIVQSQNDVAFGVETDKPYMCEKEMKIRCTYTGTASPCCNLTRVWRVNSLPVLTDGNLASNVEAGKYAEGEVNHNGKYFTLIINNLEEADLEKKYSCTYDFDDLQTAVSIGSRCFCGDCSWQCILYALLGLVVGFIIELSINYKLLSAKDHVRKAIVVGIEGLVISLAAAGSIGYFLCPCLSSIGPIFIAVGFVFGSTLLLVLLYQYKFGDKDAEGLCQLISLGVLTIGIWIVVKKCTNGGKNQSVESGSSCWPICRVGQDPNTSSSDPEKVGRSSKKESADKKPTGFVRPQPSKAQHLGTDNTGRAEYSAEDEMYSEKILKSNKPRLLPSIGQQTDSPRPLPQMPASAQQGGNQLAPLEKKKKKRKKKREAKQSDEENSTEL